MGISLLIQDKASPLRADAFGQPITNVDTVVAALASLSPVLPIRVAPKCLLSD